MKDKPVKISYEKIAEMTGEEDGPPPLADLVGELKCAINNETLAKEYRISIEKDIESALMYEGLIDEDTKKITADDLEISFGKNIVVDQEKAESFEAWVSELANDEEWKDRFTGYEEGFFKKSVKYSTTQTELNSIDKSSDMWDILCDIIELKPKKTSFKFKKENDDAISKADNVQRRISDLYKNKG